MNAKIIVLFNHKGGVSKTTSTFNVGWKLAQEGKRVLLVDGDPQCNLTGLVLGAENFEDYYTNTRTEHANIKDAVSMAFEGKPQPIEAIECPQAVNNENLYLIPGHMDLSEYEPALSLSLNSNNAYTTLQNLPGAFYRLIECCVDRYQIDYVFIDMNPGLSSLNQVFFMMSDGFIVPTNPDVFSIMALRTIKKVLPRWKRQAIDFAQMFADASYPFPRARMLFLGEIIQRFNLRRGVAAGPYRKRISEIKRFVGKELLPTFKTEGMIPEALSAGTESVCCIAEISEFGALQQKSQEARRPVFDLTKEQLGAGIVGETNEMSRQRFDALFKKVADRIQNCL